MSHSVFYSFLGSLLPILVYLLFIRWMDRYEREPLKNFIIVFLYGAVVSSAFSYVGNTLVSMMSAPFLTYDGHDYFVASLIAPLVEEFNKGLIVVALLYLSKDFNSTTDGLVYGATVGLGFAFSENVMYFERIYQNGGVFEWVHAIYLRGFFLAGIHASASALFGAGCGYARTKKGMPRAVFIVVGYFMALMTHSFWNSFVTVAGIAQDNLLGYVPFVGIPFLFFLLFILFEISLSEERDRIKRQLTIEATTQNTIPAEHVNYLSSFFKRHHGNWFPMKRGKKEYLMQTTQLAFLLDDVEKGIIDPIQAQPQIDTLRSSIKSLLNQSGSVVSLLLVIIGLLGFFSAVAVYGIWQWRYLLVHFPAYKTAQTFIENHPVILDEFGGIASYGEWPRGRFSYNKIEGKGYLDLSIKGTRSEGVIKLSFKNEQGRAWQVVDASLQKGSTSEVLLPVPLDYKKDTQFFINQGDFKQAEAQCQLLQAMVPDSYVTTDCWGLIYFAKKDHEAYVKLYAHQRDLDPNYYLYELKYGQSLLDTGRDEEAVEPLVKAWNLSPGVDVANELSAAYLNLGKLNEALVFLDKAKGYGSAELNHIIQFNYGIYYYKQKKYEEALPYFEETIKLNPEYYRAYVMLSDCYYYLGQEEKVVYYLEQALTRNPWGDEDRKYLVNYLISKNRPYEAIYHAIKFDQYSLNKDEAGRLLQLAEDSLK